MTASDSSPETQLGHSGGDGGGGDGADRHARTRAQVHAGLRWVSAGMASSWLLSWGVRIALARILTKADFGLLFLCLAAVEVLASIRELGFGQAYIQRKERPDEDPTVAADTVFVLGMLLNGVLFGVAQLAAPAIASFYGDPALEPIARVVFVVFLIDAFLATPSVVLQRRMQFGRHAIAEVVPAVVTGAVAIPLALGGAGVWSLVAGELAARVVQAGLLVRLSGWRPRVRFDRAIAAEMFAFGRYLWAFTVLSAVGRVVDRILVGRWYGSGSVGAYGVAFNLCNMPATRVSALVNRVAFPALARIQDDHAALRRAFRKALTHTALLSLPLGFGLLVTANEFVVTVYGTKWAEAAGYVEVLAIYGIAISVSSIAGPVLKAVGRPSALLYTSIVHHANRTA